MSTCRQLFLMIGLSGAFPIMAQTTTADAYFNQASKEYVKEDKMEALRTLDKALQQYPGDPKLLKLAEELVKEEEKQQQKQQQQQEQQQKEQEKNEKNEQDQQKEQQDQQKQDQQQQEKQQEEQKRQQEQENAQKGESKDQQGQPKAGTIAPQDAMRMLDALERSEKDVQDKVRAKRRPASRRSIQKDW